MSTSVRSIRQLRVQAGWSLRGLAAHAGLSTTAIGKRERGKQIPLRFALCRLAEALHLDADELAARFGQPNPTPSPPHTWDSNRVGGGACPLAGLGRRQPTRPGRCCRPRRHRGRSRRTGPLPLPVTLARVAGARYGFDTAAAVAAAGYDTHLPSPSRWSAGEFAELWPRLRWLADLSVRDVADAHRHVARGGGLLGRARR